MPSSKANSIETRGHTQKQKGGLFVAFEFAFSAQPVLLRLGVRVQIRSDTSVHGAHDQSRDDGLHQQDAGRVADPQTVRRPFLNAGVVQCDLVNSE